MELDDMKKVWSKMSSTHESITYTAEEINAFRKARSHDFTHYISSSLGFDLILKALISLASISLAIIYFDQVWVTVLCVGLALATLAMIRIEYRSRKSVAALDDEVGSVMQSLQNKVSYLKKCYIRIQLIQGVSNPLLVLIGGLIYYRITYACIPLLQIEDILVISAILVISYLFTLPTNFSMYLVHMKTLRGCLESFTDPDGYEREMVRYHKQKRILFLTLALFVLVGIILLVGVILL